MVRTASVERLSTSLCNIKLENPVIPASGTFGYGYEFAELYDINCLGALSFKGTTREERFGNKTPRIAECSCGLLNSVGLQNPGVENVIYEELPKLRSVYDKPIMANVGGFSEDDYKYTSARLDREDQVEWIELNISCPNVHEGGANFGSNPASAANIVHAVKEVTAKPIIVKLSPNVTDIATIAKACEDAGADGISLINTLIGMRIDLRKRSPLLANTTGGLSGSAILPIALSMVYQVYEAVSIPIIGIGGISSADNVIEMMLAGASAVEIGAVNLINPYACKNIIEDLPAALDKYEIDKISDIIGGAHE